MKTKWLKVVEFAVVGLATWFVTYGELPIASVPVSPQPACVEATRSRQAEAHRQFLLFLLKLSFQVLIALRDRDRPQASNAEQVFWCKWVLWGLVKSDAAKPSEV